MTPHGRDLITLTGLEVFAHHGVYDFERENGQRFLLDLELHSPLAVAAATDDVAATIHYGDLATRVAEAAAADPVDLIETLAHRIAETVLEDPRIHGVRVTVHKPDAPITLGFQDVSVTIERRRDAGGVPVVIALGGNLGEREAILARAVAVLGRLSGLSAVRPSPVVETVALTREGPDADKPPYLNQVVLATTSLTPEELLDALLAIESVSGRERTEDWGDRTLDLDLISYGELIQNDPRVTLPHPRAHERDFVLAPWAMVDADGVLPGRGRIADLLAAVDTKTLRVVASAAGD